MPRSNRQRVLSGVETDGFIGRAGDVERLTAHAEGSGERRGLMLLAAPGVGLTELLRQAFDRLFLAGGEIIPFYFQFRPGGETGIETARRFVYELVLQTVAFRRRDASIIDAAPAIEELSQLAAPADARWIDRLIEAVGRPSASNAPPFIRDCFSSVGRAASQGARIAVFLDDIHHASHSDRRIFETVKQAFENAVSPWVFAGRRRFNFGRIDAGRMLLDALSFTDAGSLAESLAGRAGIEISEECRDLFAVQFNGNARMLTAAIREAADDKIALTSFSAAEQAYAEAVFGGGITSWFDELLSSAVPEPAEYAVLDILYDTAVLRGSGVTIEAWKRALAKADAPATLDLLNLHEFIRRTSNRVELPPENVALFDHITARHRLEVRGELRAIVYGSSLSGFIARAPELMEAFYRQRSAIGVRSLLSAFSGQQVPAVLVDNRRFRDELKGLPDDEALAAARVSADRVTLPKIYFVADASAFDFRSEAGLENERAAVGQGTATDASGERLEAVWLVAEVDSKLEASLEVAAAWCDRFDTLAANAGFENVRIWLVAPEGFTDEALKLLDERGAYGSSRKQFQLLRAEIDAAAAGTAAEHEYEIVLPMGEDAEMIAANAVEEIARRYNFTPKAINQIKTALVEACINAAEHSLSPDQKIYQKFSVDGEKLTITISNRGLRLAERATSAESEPTGGRRGWGLQLMRRLMDEVTIEDVDDGTRISMIKYLTPADAARSA